MIKKLKKGFTIVELVIVIAIVAILAAVLVPTFANIIDKANVSADTMLVRNLNTALKADNQEHKTMTSALQAAKDAGYDISRINAQATNSEILWDSLNDTFCYKKGDEGVVYLPEITDKKEVGNNTYYYWQIANKGETLSPDYSNYLAADYEVSGTLAISTGLDVGEVTGITSVTYTGGETEKKVTIRTTEGKLTVNAENDTVYHYGEVESVAIEKVAGESYHEYGRAGYVEIAEGRFVAEADSKVIALVVVGTSDEVVVKKEANAVIDAAYTTVANNTNPDGNVELSTTLPFTNDTKADYIYNIEAQIVNAVMVNEKYYKSMSEFFDKCKKENGDGYDLTGENTIKLLRDIEGPGLFTEDGSTNVKIVFDFNGYTYTVNGLVGSSGYATQAMHFGAKGVDGDEMNQVTLKNGMLKVKDQTGVAMVLQNYAQLTIENMTIDYTNVAVGFYGNSYTGAYAKYNGLEIPLFNNNYNGGYSSMAIKDSTIICPENSTAGVYFEGTKGEIINSTIKGYVAVSSDSVKGCVKITNSTIEKGVKAYFAANTLTQVADGEGTKYSIE